MSTTLTRSQPNWVTFPRELRELRLGFTPCLGRVLQLENADVGAMDSEWTGRRVAIRLTVCETASLSGTFDVVVSLNIDAARALGDVLHSAATKAAKL